MNEWKKGARFQKRFLVSAKKYSTDRHQTSWGLGWSTYVRALFVAADDRFICGFGWLIHFKICNAFNVIQVG